MNNTDLRDFLGFALVLFVLTYLSLGESRYKYGLSSPGAFVDFFSDIFSSDSEDVLDSIEKNNSPPPPLESKSKDVIKPVEEKEKEPIKEKIEKTVNVKEEPKPEKKVKIQPAPVPEEKKEIVKEEKKIVSIPDKGALIYYDTPPELRGKLDLKYPNNARANKIEGTVFIEFYINKDGNVLKADLYQGLQERSLNDAAKDAILDSKWKPALNKGESVGVWIVVPIEFKITQEFY